MNKLVSFDLHADFGCMKKPDTNDPVYLTFNMLHKPALLGMLGAVVGLEGFKEKPQIKKKKGKNPFSEEEEVQPKVAAYYDVLQDLKIGIRPLRHDNGNFSKTILTYNNAVGYANLVNKVPNNLMVTEQMLISPAYRCYVLFEIENEMFRQLYQNLKNYDAEYLPYMGKNEFSVFWNNWREYTFQRFEPEERPFEIKSIFIKTQPVKEGKAKAFFKISQLARFMYFENLPVGYDMELMQYFYQPFAYTDNQMKQDYPVQNLYQLTETDEVVQLF